MATNEYMRQYYKDHPEYRKQNMERTKQRRKDNPEERKEWDKKYNNSESHKKSNKKYRKTNKGKANGDKWNESESHKKAMKKYNKSEAGKKSQQKYQTSEKKRITSRKNHLKRKYNLSHEDWLKMWENQDGKCLICGKLFIEPSDACVDHNHKTGKVRSLLCKKCNLGIGYLNDDPKLTIKATKYLMEA